MRGGACAYFQDQDACGNSTLSHGITHASLIEAVERAKQGLIDADLGGRVIKQRVARSEAVVAFGCRQASALIARRSLFAYAAKRAETSATAESLCGARFLNVFKVKEPANRKALKIGKLLLR